MGVTGKHDGVLDVVIIEVLESAVLVRTVGLDTRVRGGRLLMI